MSSASSLKEELFNLKNRLETIESQLTNQSKQIEERESSWSKLEPKMEYILQTQGDKLKLNVGGEKFSVSVTSLKNIRDSFLCRLVESGKIDLKEEVFIDRSPKLFKIILDFYRFQKIELSELTKREFEELKVEATYYSIDEIISYLDEVLIGAKFVGLETSGEYAHKGEVAGTNKVEDLHSTDLTTGVCAKAPGKIIIELKGEYEVKNIEIGGWTGNSKIWYADNGSGAKIYTSLDKTTWVHIGQIPSGYGTKIKPVKVTKTTKARYIKFEATSFVGIGHLKVTSNIKFKDE